RLEEDLMGRIAMVTGGSRGIGAAIAKRLQKDGFTVVVCDLDEDRMAAFENETGIKGYKINVADFADVQKGIEKIEAEVGPIDVLVNNAGITRDGFMHKMDPDAQWKAVIDVNLTSVFNTCRVAAPGMRDRGYGRIINISSINGIKGQFGQCNYAAAKAGILGFTKSIAQELAAKGVTANAIAPGFIKTEMTGAMKPEILEGERQKIPTGRLGEPEEIASMAAYLASDESAFVNGATMYVNGGQLM
ncbi:MAG: acetoacetyl-CoA reductase, partial [Rhodospirillales bacterium]